MTFKNLIISALTLAIFIVSIIYTNTALSTIPEPKVSHQPQFEKKVSVITRRVTHHPSSLIVYGETKAKKSLLLKSQVSGKVIWINPDVIVGAVIKKNDLLLKLEPTDLLAQLATAKRSVADALVELNKEQQRAKQAKLEWKSSGLTEKPSSLLMRKPQLAAANAKYRQTKSNLKKAQYYLEQANIYAPFDALVTELPITEGSIIQSDSSIVRLDSIATSEIKIPLNTSQLQLLPPKLSLAKVTVQNPDYPNAVWKGKIIHLSNKLSLNSRQREITIKVDAPLTYSPPLLNGSFVTVKIEGKTLNNVFQIPKSALSPQGNIWSIVNNRLKKHKADILFTTNNAFFIKQGDLPNVASLAVYPLISFLPNLAVQAQPIEE